MSGELNAIAGAVHDNLTGLGWRKPRAGSPFDLVRDHGHRAVRVDILPSRIGRCVTVTVSWVNMAGGTPTVGQQTATILGHGNMDHTIDAIRKAVLLCLRVYRDVISGSGVAGREALLAQILREEQQAESTVIEMGEG